MRADTRKMAQISTDTGRYAAEAQLTRSSERSELWSTTIQTATVQSLSA